jgi:hypothetical protein
MKNSMVERVFGFANQKVLKGPSHEGDVSPQKSSVVSALELKITNPMGWQIFALERDHRKKY